MYLSVIGNNLLQSEDCKNHFRRSKHYAERGGARGKHYAERGNDYSTISGGYFNTTCSTYSVIAGGAYHTIFPAAHHSAILGGCQNVVSHPYSAVFGDSVSSAAPHTFHVKCLNALNTPCTTLGLPTGTIFRCSVGSILPAGALPLYIMP